jgi:hypothetical protein
MQLTRALPDEFWVHGAGDGVLDLLQSRPHAVGRRDAQGTKKPPLAKAGAQGAAAQARQIS